MVKLLTADNSSAKASQPARSGLPVSHELIDDLVKLFKLLSDETRLRILYFLTQNDELHVRALCERLGESQPAVSHHLALLREAGVIDRRRQGKHNFYALQTHRFSELLDQVFADVPPGARRLRFENYALDRSPV